MKRLILFAACWWLLFPVLSQATTRYLSSSGASDANSCAASTNPSTPKANFQGASGAIPCMSAGDILYVCAAACDGAGSATLTQTINSDTQQLPNGTAGNPITIAAYPGETITLRPSSGANIILLNAYNSPGDIQYITFDRLILDTAVMSDYAMVLIGPPGGNEPHHIMFQNGEIKNTPSTPLVQLNGHHNTIRTTLIHDSGDSYGIYMGGHDQLIENNTIYNNAGYAVQIFDGSPGHDIRNVTIRNNRMYNNGFSRGTAQLTVNGSYDTWVYNNLIYNGYGGIQVRYGGGSAHYPSDTLIYNNTLYNNNGECVAVGGDATHPTDTRVQNNVCASTGTVTDSGGVNTVISNNLTTDPSFVSAGSADFHLQSGSSAINAGVSQSGTFTTDYEGNSRPQGAAWDIGAYEFGGTVNTAAKVRITAQPANTVLGFLLPTVTVQVLDASDALVATSTATVVIALGTNPSGATLGGTLSVAAVGGKATFNTLNLQTPGVGYTLTASSSGLTGDTSQAFTVFGTEWVALGTVSVPCSATAGDTNSSATGTASDYTHSLTCQLPPNTLTTGTVVRACTLLSLHTGTTGALLVTKLKAGATTLVSNGGVDAPPANIGVSSAWTCFNLTSSGPPGGAVNVYSTFESHYGEGLAFDTDTNITTQPLAIATNGTLPLSITTQWASSGSSDLTVSQLAFFVEVTAQ